MDHYPSDMRVLLVAAGSRGDVQPFVALGVGLRRAGHEVTVCSTGDFGSLVGEHELAFIGSKLSATAVMDSELGREWLGHSSHNQFVELRRFRAFVRTWGVRMAGETAALAGSFDLVISGVLTAYGSQALAEASGARHVIALLAPFEPTRAGWAGVQAPLPDRWSRRNLVAGIMGSWILADIIRPPGERVRELLGLPRGNRRQVRQVFRGTPTLLGFSAAVVPPPADWSSGQLITGYWFLDDGAPPEPERGRIEEFLAAGDPPVYVGFGSMSTRDAAGTMASIVEALARTGRRGIVSSGGAGLVSAGEESDDVLLVGPVSHSWLFPQCAGAIHHGGAGTTAAALAAGIPQGVVAHIGDQPYWGRRVSELGVGASPIRRHELSADSLTAMIADVVDPVRKLRAIALGDRIRAEDGVARAVAQLSELVR